MLNRTVSSPISWPLARWRLWQRSLHAEINLARYLLFVLVICALACVYYWQASEMRKLQEETAALEEKAYLLEQENIRLAGQLAQWSSPAYVEKRMREEGYIPAPMVLRVQLPSSSMPGSDSQPMRQVARSALSP
ncbi:MAG: septum formation initiator family protein [Anaerolineae bacterium]|nr:septum formation initiator family protein [Anaerolineae bacterium]